MALTDRPLNRICFASDINGLSSACITRYSWFASNKYIIRCLFRTHNSPNVSCPGISLLLRISYCNFQKNKPKWKRKKLAISFFQVISVPLDSFSSSGAKIKNKNKEQNSNNDGADFQNKYSLGYKCNIDIG